MRNKVLEVAGLTKSFDGFVAVNKVSFSVREGEILGLIGPNGSGKSTIFKVARDCLSLLNLPFEQHSSVEGLGAAGLKKLELARARDGPKLLLADEPYKGGDVGLCPHRLWGGRA